MFEKICFNLLAFSLFIIIFFKIVKKNDSNYVSLLIIQAIGIAISFIEIRIGITADTFWIFLRYILAIILPIGIIIIEINGINFSEVLSIIVANAFLMLGNTKTAKAILVKLVSKYKESYRGHKLLAEIYEKEGGMRRAIDEYVTVVDIKKNDDKSYFKIAELLRDLGKKNESIEMLENLIKTKPNCYKASCLLGELLCEQERFKEAVNVYQQALIYRPADWDLYYNLGIVYTRLSDFQMAKEMYEKAASINHKLYGAHYNLGQIAFIQRDFETAEKCFENSLYEDLEAMSYYQLAKIYVIKGEKDKAINFLNKAIELDSRLLKMATQEKYFDKIKEYITVSVKMNEEEKEIASEDDTIILPSSKISILKQQEEIARKYLEDTSKLVEIMSENTSKLKVEERVNFIFNREKLKKEKIQKEIDSGILEKKKKEKEERQKN